MSSCGLAVLFIISHSIGEPPKPMVYVPLARREPLPQKEFYLGVRSAGGSPALLERSVAAAINAFNPDVAFSFEPLAQQVDEAAPLPLAEAAGKSYIA